MSPLKDKISALSKGKKFGIQLKMLLLLLIVAFFVLAVIASGVIGFQKISSVSSRITEKEFPLVVSIQGALSAMIAGQSTIERTLDLDINDPLLVSSISSLQSAFNTSVSRFNMFISAITWGSETEAFKSSANGSNYQSWVDNGFQGTLIVLEPSQEEKQLAAETSLYYNGFINNVLNALIAHRSYLDHISMGHTKLAEEDKHKSEEAIAKARHFSELSINSLGEMVSLSNASITASANTLKNTEANVKTAVVLISIIGSLFSLILSMVFAQRVIITPLRELSRTAALFGEGKLDARITLHTGDEIETLGATFNSMADNIALHTANLETEVAKRTRELGAKVEELNTSNAMLTKREEELTLANERLRELDKAKSEFISVAAHQLRTPLSAIKWTLSLIIDEDTKNLTPEQRGLIMKGYESNERIIRLVNELLTVTRIEAGKVQYALSRFHIDDLIDSVLLDFTGVARDRRIRLSFEKSQAALPYVNADAEKIRSVIQNLVENSMWYTRDGGEVVVSSGLEGNLIKVSVRDNGIGIPERQKSGIFNKFFRADNAMRTKTDGSGLGLFVAKSVVEAHGGTIGFTSREGDGTTFYFTIPPAPPAA